MSRAAVSSIAFGIYVLSMAAGMILSPDLLLAIFGLPPTDEPWIRVLGAVAFALGLYYVQCGRHEAVAFFRASLVGRTCFATVMVGVAAAWQEPVFLLFAAVDVLGAIWTAWGLRVGQEGT